MESQNKRLLDYLKQGKRVDPLIAWSELGIYRLGSRIFDLRDSGHLVDDEWVKVPNRFGEEIRVKSYFIKENSLT